MNKLLKKINKTDDVARKVGFGGHMSEHTGENNNLVNEMTLSRMKLSEITSELKIDCRSALRIIDQDLDFRFRRKCKA